MTVVGTAYIDVKPKVDGFEKDVGKKAQSAAKTAAGIFGATFAAAKVFDFLGGAVQERREADRAARQSEAVIRSTGGAAKVTAGDLDRLTESVMKKQHVDDDAVRSGANLLLTFTNVRNEVGRGNDIFDQATRTAVDMGAALGGDAASQAIQLGKALNDPIKGITALTRVGVTFTEQQKETIRRMVETGDVIGAQRIILAELNKEFGGSAAAQADSLDKAALRWGEFKEEVGGAVLPILEWLAELDSGIVKVGIAIGGLGAGAYAIGKVAGAVSSVVDVATALGPRLAVAANSARLLTALGWAGMAAGIGVAAYAVWELASNVDRVHINVEKLARSTDRELVSAFQEVLDMAGRAAGEDVFKELLADSPAQAQRLVTALHAAGEETGWMQTKIDAAAKAQGEGARSTAAAERELDKLAGTSRDSASATDSVAEAERNAKEAQDRRTEAIKDQLGAMTGLLGVQLAYAGSVDSLRDSQIEMTEKERALAEAIRTHGRNSAEAKVAGEELEDSRRRALGDIDALANAQVRLAEQQATAAGKTLNDAQKYDAYRDALIRTKDTIAPGSPLRVHLEELINALPPSRHQMEVIAQTSDAKAKLEELQALARNLAGRFDFNFGRGLVGPGRQHGGPVRAGGGYVVGEKHAEWFEPDQSGWVYPRVPQVARVPESQAAIPPGLVSVIRRLARAQPQAVFENLVVPNATLDTAHEVAVRTASLVSAAVLSGTV